MAGGNALQKHFSWRLSFSPFVPAHAGTQCQVHKLRKSGSPLARGRTEGVAKGRTHSLEDEKDTP